MAPFQLIVCVSVLIFIGKEIVKPVQLKNETIVSKSVLISFNNVSLTI